MGNQVGTPAPMTPRTSFLHPEGLVGARSTRHHLGAHVPLQVTCLLKRIPHPAGHLLQPQPRLREPLQDGGQSPPDHTVRMCPDSACVSPQAVSDAKRSPSGCRTCGWCNPPGPRSPPRTPGCFRTSSSPGPASTDSTSPAGTIRRNNRPVGAFPHLVALPRALDTRPRQAAVKPSTEWGEHFHLKNGKRGRLMSRLLTHSHPHVLAEPLLADLGPEQEGLTWRRAAPSPGGPPAPQTPPTGLSRLFLPAQH